MNTGVSEHNLCAYKTELFLKEFVQNAKWEK